MFKLIQSIGCFLESWYFGLFEKKQPMINSVIADYDKVCSFITVEKNTYKECETLVRLFKLEYPAQKIMISRLEYMLSQHLPDINQ